MIKIIAEKSTNLEHFRHRSVKGFFINIFTAVAAYAFRPKKPAINMNKARLVCNS